MVEAIGRKRTLALWHSAETRTETGSTAPDPTRENAGDNSIDWWIRRRHPRKGEIVGRPGGRSFYDPLIFFKNRRQTLVEKKAAEKKITVSEEEINTAIDEIRKNLETQGMTLEEALQKENITLGELHKTIRMQRLAERLVEDQLAVSDEDVKKYIEENRDYLPPAGSEEEKKNAVRSMLRQQKFASVFQAWLNAAKAEANISYWKEY